MKNSTLTENATNVKATKEGIKLGTKKAPKTNDDVLIKRGIAETLIACEEYTKGQASKMATIIFYDSKPELTIQETKYKANALMFFECKSLSKVFNELTKSKNAEVLHLLKISSERQQCQVLRHSAKKRRRAKSFLAYGMALTS